MASGLTPAKQRPYPLESDVPDVAADLHSLALSVENVPNFYQGSLAGRAAVTPTIGDRYVVEGDATSSNNGREWYWNGTAWIALFTPWVSINKSTNVNTAPGAYTPASRVVGDRVELCGGLVNNTGGTITIWGVLAGGLGFPAATVNFAATLTGAALVSVTINTSGQIVTPPIANGTPLFLDSCWFRQV